MSSQSWESCHFLAGLSRKMSMYIPRCQMSKHQDGLEDVLELLRDWSTTKSGTKGPEAGVVPGRAA